MLINKALDDAFKAGQDSRLKEVEEWIREHNTSYLSVIINIPFKDWQAFLKGLEGNII